MLTSIKTKGYVMINLYSAISNGREDANRYPFVQRRSPLMKELTGFVWLRRERFPMLPMKIDIPIHLADWSVVFPLRLLLPTNYRAQGTWPKVTNLPAFVFQHYALEISPSARIQEAVPPSPFPAYRVSLTCLDEITRAALIYMQVTHLVQHACGQI